MNIRIFLRKIFNTKGFLFTLANHLDDIFPKGWHDSYKEYNRVYDVAIGVDGTNGWHDALELTCKEHGLEDCLKYYDSLYWIESDEVDYIISTFMEIMIFDECGNRIKGE